MNTSRLTVRVCHTNALVAAGVMSLINEAGDFAVHAGEGTAMNEPCADVIVADYTHALGLLARPISPGDVPSSGGITAPRIVVLTARAKECDVVHAIKSGANAYLLHDASPLELIDSIRHVARGGSRYLCRHSAAVIAQNHLESDLTPREVDVLQLLVSGECNKGIARKLAISAHTVKAHISRICEKLHVKSRTQAVVKAAQRGLVSLQ